jgi:uncharacterized protein (TIGR00730 family)
MTNPARTPVERLVDQLVTAIDPATNRDQVRAILRSAAGLATDNADRLDLKITNAALREMRDAFAVFAPYRHVPKVTIFGSARTEPDDPLYDQARRLAAELAELGWMVITGAGPGIMAAGIEGAGRENAFGVNIRLPFEQSAHELIAGDDKLVEMRYFFTRKLMLMKESQAFAALPGGFGTLDETFELLTLQQTGKAVPAPIVCLDTPGGTYWSAWRQFLEDEVAAARLISPGDLELFRVTDSVERAVDHLAGFYRNYHSSRFVGDELVIRLRAAPAPDELEALNGNFADLCDGEGIRMVPPFAEERGEPDTLDLPRVALRFDRHSFGRLHLLIEELNGLQSAPGAEGQGRAPA